MSDPSRDDIMSRLAGVAAGTPLAATRALRPDVVRFTETSDDAIFRPTSDGGLSRTERLQAALQMAGLLRDDVLAGHYRSLLGSTAPDAGSERAKRIAAHVERVTLEPGASQKEHIGALAEAGLSPQAIVALSQVIAYVNYQARVRAGLRALGGLS